MFKANMVFKTREDKKIIIKDHQDGLFRNGDDEGVSKKSLFLAKNLFYNNRGFLINRPTPRFFASGLPDNGDFVSGIGYSKGVGDYVCIKGTLAYKSSSLGGNWTSIGTFSTVGSTDYTDIIDFYTLSGTADITSTTNSVGDERYIDSALTLTVNAHVGKYIWVGSQARLIIANTDTRIFINEKFNSVPGSGATYNIYPKIPALFFITEGPSMKVWDGTVFGNGRPSGNIDAMRGTKENNRLFIVDPTNKYRIKYSILGVGSDFPPLNYIDVEFEIKAIKNIKGRVIIYGEHDRAELLGDNPDNFTIVNSLTHKGTLSGGSISNGSNVQFFLSGEGIEQLNAIDNATATEGVSISDKIKDLIFDETIWGMTNSQFLDVKERAHGVVSGGKYYLSLGGNIIIYDFENSTLINSRLFSTAEFTEASQYVDTGYDEVGEWTCSRDINGILFFGQGGKVCYMEETSNYELYEYKVVMASDRLNLGDNNRTKKIRRIKQNWKPCEKTTEFKIYISIDGGAYELVMTTNDFEYEIFLSKIGEDIRIKTEITQTGSGAMIYQHLQTVVYIDPQYMY